MTPTAETELSKLHRLVDRAPGYRFLTPLFGHLLFSMQLREGEMVHLKSDKYRVEITPELRGRIDDLLGTGNYRLLMSRPK